VVGRVVAAQAAPAGVDLPVAGELLGGEGLVPGAGRAGRGGGAVGGGHRRLLGWCDGRWWPRRTSSSGHTLRAPQARRNPRIRRTSPIFLPRRTFLWHRVRMVHDEAASPRTAPPDDDSFDPLLIGRRIRARRQQRGLSLAELAAAVGRAPSQLSVIENGRRELKLGELRRIARALEVGVDDLLEAEPPNRRAALEIALEKAQAGALYQSLSLPELPVRRSLSDAAIETVLALHEELRRLHEERAATPEEARRVNGQLREEQSRAGNYDA